MKIEWAAASTKRGIIWVATILLATAVTKQNLLGGL